MAENFKLDNFLINKNSYFYDQIRHSKKYKVEFHQISSNPNFTIFVDLIVKCGDWQM